MRLFFRKNPGFTLLEVMVAVALLSFALVSLLGSVNRNIELTTRSNNTEIAAELAQNIISRIEVEGISNVTEDQGIFEEHPGFEWNLSILPYNLGALDAEINMIQVVVTWDEGEESYALNLAVEG